MLFSAEWITAVASSALAVLTMAYTISTLLLFQESRAARLEAARPSLHLSPQVLGVNFPVARITNVGRGYAKNIRGDLWMTIAGNEVWRFRWHMDLIAPSSHHDFMMRTNDHEPQPNVVDVARDARQFHMAVRYEDHLGRPSSVVGRADWSDVADHLFGAQMIVRDDHHQKIEKHLASMARSLHDAVDTFDGVKVMTYRDRRLKTEDDQKLVNRLTTERESADETKRDSATE